MKPVLHWTGLLLVVMYVEETGTCSKNNLCNMVECIVDKDSMSIKIQFNFSRSPCDTPVKLHFRREFTNGTVIVEKETKKHVFIEVERGSTVELLLKQTEWNTFCSIFVYRYPCKFFFSKIANACIIVFNNIS